MSIKVTIGTVLMVSVNVMVPKHLMEPQIRVSAQELVKCGLEMVRMARVLAQRVKFGMVPMIYVDVQEEKFGKL